MAPGQEKNVFSTEGYKYFQTRLAQLESQTRASGKAVGEAAGPSCDWHDNFEFEDSRRKLELDSERVRTLAADMAGARIVDITEQVAKVAIGNTVEIELSDGNEREITIGAWGESDPNSGLVAYTAPLARSILGKAEGDEGKFRELDVYIKTIHPASHKYRKLIADLFAK